MSDQTGHTAAYNYDATGNTTSVQNTGTPDLRVQSFTPTSGMGSKGIDHIEVSAMTRRGPRTAAEIMAELLPTEEARAEHEAELERHRRESRAMYYEAATPVLADLAAAGFHVETIGELRRLGPKAKATVPILVKWLPLVTYDAAKADILGALAVRWAN
ncbi:MAG TPA: hypothetical protein VFE14_05390, partial [Micromonosporaceae bacterium]|nr:hypothetical protein [Micromonosporaceae bacterium]